MPAGFGVDPSNGLTDGSQPGAGWDGIGDNNYGYGNPNETAATDRGPGGIGEMETAPTNFGAMNNTLFDTGADYDQSAWTAADTNGTEGYANNGDNYGYGNPNETGYSPSNDWSYSDDYGYGNSDPAGYTPTNDWSYSDDYGYGNTDSGADTSYDYGAYDTGDAYNAPAYGYDYGEPVVLDLAGNGIKITDLSQSAAYFDMAGDGYQHRTAWVGAGNGVLVLDLAGNGQITQRNQIVFTDWDPTAKTKNFRLCARAIST